jgi:hypothetical protein
MDGLFCSYSGLSLSGSDGAESHKEFVVYSPGIVEKRSNNSLDLVLARIIEEFRCITFRSELCLGTIGDGQACVGRESSPARARMFELDEQIVNVPGHAELAVLARIIPLDGDACKFVTHHVDLHTMEFLE